MILYLQPTENACQVSSHLSPETFFVGIKGEGVRIPQPSHAPLSFWLWGTGRRRASTGFIRRGSARGSGWGKVGGWEWGVGAGMGLRLRFTFSQKSERWDEAPGIVFEIPSMNVNKAFAVFPRDMKKQHSILLEENESSFQVLVLVVKQKKNTIARKREKRTHTHTHTREKTTQHNTHARPRATLQLPVSGVGM